MEKQRFQVSLQVCCLFAIILSCWYFPTKGYATSPQILTIVLSDGTRVHYEKPPSSLSKLSHNLIKSWLEINVCAIRAYYGRFPMAEFSLLLRAVEGSTEISYGNAMPGEMPRITMYVGTQATEEEFRSSWVMCHEMTHLTFPTLARKYHWMEEGMATYVEPIARAMTGIISVESVWYDLITKTPDAFAIETDSGLDGASDFRRVYWGGALYFLLADIEIRRSTKNKYSLQTALRAIMQKEGTMNNDRNILSVLRTGDKSVSGSVLEKLYATMGKAAYKPQFEKLWRDLGIERKGTTVIFHDDAPLASVRKSICSQVTTVCNEIFHQKK